MHATTCTDDHQHVYRGASRNRLVCVCVCVYPCARSRYAQPASIVQRCPWSRVACWHGACIYKGVYIQTMAQIHVYRLRIVARRLTLPQCPANPHVRPHPTDVRVALCRVSRLRSLKAGDVVFEYGESAIGVFHLLSGRVRLIEMEDPEIEDLVVYPGSSLTTGVPLLRQHISQTANAVRLHASERGRQRDRASEREGGGREGGREGGMEKVIQSIVPHAGMRTRQRDIEHYKQRFPNDPRSV